MNLSHTVKPPVSFRRKIFTFFSVTALILTIAMSAIFALLSSSTIKDMYISQGMQASENLANASELALLYNSGDNAQEAATATLAFPAINHIQLVNSDGQILLDEGNNNSMPTFPVFPDNEQEQAYIAHQDNTNWIYICPVYSSTVDDALALQGELIAAELAGKEYLGYVIVSQSKDELYQIQLEIFGRNLVIGLIYGIVLVLILHFGLKQLLRPMEKLNRAMADSSGGLPKPINEVTGPSEIHRIVTVYNRMIATIKDRDRQLTEYNMHLEGVVENRTRELVVARDEALDASKQKSMFLANMSHELRTPLQSIIGYSDVLKEALEDEGFFELTDDLGRIVHNAQHLLTLINGILDLAKLEAGKTQLNLVDTDIEKIMLQAESTMKPLMAKNNNTLSVNIQSNGILIAIDETKLLQILINLLSNAAKFTENGRVSLTAIQDEQALTIDVEDSGIGISEEEQKKIFSPFRQVDGSFTRQFEGTGLGLSICRYFSELMGGSIQLSSAPNIGSTFTVRIPLPIVVETE